MNAEPEQHEELTIGKFRFTCDDNGQLIEVPSCVGLQGYVGQKADESEYARIQILPSADESEQQRFFELWDKVCTSRTTSVFAEIIDCGIDDGIPYYISKFPHGEPLSVYLEDSPAWPGKTAARVIGKFIASLRFQEEIPANQFNITYESLWVEKTIYGPRLLIGDVVLSPGSNASADNGALMLSVFKDLTKEEEPDPAISELFKKLSQAPLSLGGVERALKQFSITGDSRPIVWTPESEPAPFLATCLAKVDAASQSHWYENKDSGSTKGTLKDLGKHLANQSLYRCAVEIDPNAKTTRLPRRFIAMWSAAFLTLVLLGFIFLTHPGKALFEEVFGGLGYSPTLVIPPTPEDTVSLAPAVEEDQIEETSIVIGSDLGIPISLNGSLMNVDGIVNGSFQAIENSINTFSNPE